nr:hypothetical protein [uncultured Moellerella sp.]
MEWFIGIIIVLIVIGTIVKLRRCDICNLGFKRKYYAWTLEGKKQHLCPSCNLKMSREVNPQKFDSKYRK